LHAPRHKASETDRGARQNDEPRDGGRPKQHGKQHGKPHGESGSRFGKPPDFEKKKRSWDKPADAGPSRPASTSPAKPAFGKKARKNRRG
jgi:ATP-dependent RNA helicase DeaD